MVSSGVIAYLGAFTSELRSETIHTWLAQMAERSIPYSSNYTFIGALGDPVAMRQWNIWGLPKDDVSAANGIVVFESKRWPLCIDPQVRHIQISTTAAATLHQHSNMFADIASCCHCRARPISGSATWRLINAWWCSSPPLTLATCAPFSPPYPWAPQCCWRAWVRHWMRLWSLCCSSSPSSR